MTYNQARQIIWAPDVHDLATVAEASETVLSTRGARSEDTHQASYLITTMRPR